MEAYIVGGGNSLYGFNFEKLKNKNTIAVNKTISYLPNARHFITMDYTFIKKLKGNIKDLVGASKTNKIFVVNYSKGTVKNIGGYIKDVKCNLVYDLRYFDLVIKSRKMNGLGFNFNDFYNGDNSGYCAFQYAVCMNYSPIYLLGIDLAIKKNLTHFHGGYGEDKEKFQKKINGYYKNWKNGLEKAKQFGVQVISCSPTSSLNDLIMYKDINEVLK